MLVQAIINGIAVGSVYALLALGMILIFKTTIVLNFAHGEMAMITTFIGLWLMRSMGLPYWAAIIGALVFGALVGIVSERIVRPLLDAPILSHLVVTLGLYFIINSLASFKWGDRSWAFHNPFPQEPLHFFKFIISPIHLGIIGVLVLLTGGLFAWLNFTTVGISFKASCQDRFAAQLMGVSSKRVAQISWAIGCVLGGIAGILIAPLTNLSVDMMGTLLLKAFAAAVLGGILSLPGAILGGLTIGVVENIFGVYVGTEFKDTVAFLVLITILIIRPQGFLGKPEDIKL